VIKHILLLARPHHYIKNLFVFLPIFFAGKLNNPEMLGRSFLCFSSFCLAASSVYILNDFLDRKEDRLHPEKRTRPIAAGQISSLSAFLTLAIFLIASLVISIFSSFSVFTVVVFYIVLNTAYSFKLKHIPIIDISIISVGFILRLVAGAEAGHIQLSQWIIVMTFLLALFLSLSKRRDDVLIFLITERKPRRVVDGYNLKFLDSAMVMTSSIVVLAYILWTLSPEVSDRLSSNRLYLTSVFVILGILRYMQITFVEEKSASPTSILLKDKFIQFSLIAWVLCFVWILYMNH
jgi:4-hydroxybenzoate polyprenyltransferase